MKDEAEGGHDLVIQFMHKQSATVDKLIRIYVQCKRLVTNDGKPYVDFMCVSHLIRDQLNQKNCVGLVTTNSTNSKAGRTETYHNSPRCLNKPFCPGLWPHPSSILPLINLSVTMCVSSTHCSSRFMLNHSLCIRLRLYMGPGTLLLIIPSDIAYS